MRGGCIYLRKLNEGTGRREASDDYMREDYDDGDCSIARLTPPHSRPLPGVLDSRERGMGMSRTQQPVEQAERSRVHKR